MNIKKGKSTSLHQFVNNWGATSFNHYRYYREFGKKSWGKEIIKILNLK